MMVATSGAIFEELSSRIEFGGMSVVGQASRLHINGCRLAIGFVRARRPHHNPLSNALSFVGHASRVPGVRAAFPSSVNPRETVSFCHSDRASPPLFCHSDRASSASERRNLWSGWLRVDLLLTGLS